MTVLAEIKKLIKEAKAAIGNSIFDPLEFLEKSSEVLRQACGKGGSYDPLNLPRGERHSQEGQDAYFAVVNFLTDEDYVWAAEQLLIDWWNDFGLRKRVEKQLIYQANTAYRLMKLYRDQKDRGAALRWALLTQADDVLNEHPKDGGAGKQQLRTVFGMSQPELDEFNRIAKENRAQANGDWSGPAGFAEDVLVRFALGNLQFTHLLARSSFVQEFPLSQGYFQALLECLDNDKPTTKERGEALENIASYLFLLIPGWVPRRNLLDIEGTSEHDIIVSNLNPSGNLSAELLGRYFLVECKNWSEKVGAPHVGYFLYRMHLAHADFGIIIAREGITGKDERNAQALIRRAYHEDGSTCIVLDREDLNALAERQSAVWAMLVERMERFRFGDSKYTG